MTFFELNNLTVKRWEYIWSPLIHPNLELSLNLNTDTLTVLRHTLLLRELNLYTDTLTVLRHTLLLRELNLYTDTLTVLRHTLLLRELNLYTDTLTVLRHTLLLRELNLYTDTLTVLRHTLLLRELNLYTDTLTVLRHTLLLRELNLYTDTFNSSPPYLAVKGLEWLGFDLGGWSWVNLVLVGRSQCCLLSGRVRRLQRLVSLVFFLETGTGGWHNERVKTSSIDNKPYFPFFCD